MQLISKFNKGFKFLLCVIDVLEGITITNAFQKILEEYNRKSNKIWVDKGNFTIILLKNG